MSIWNVQSVAEQPSVTLVNWQIFQTELGERHFVGYCQENHEGRVSSAIQSFDPATRRGVTKSGRVYELIDEPGQDLDALYVWGVWAEINNVRRFTDLTEEIASALKATIQKPPAPSATGGRLGEGYPVRPTSTRKRR